MNIQELRQQAVTLLSESSLSKEDKSTWEEQLRGADLNQLEFFIGVVSKDEDVLALATESLKKKIPVVDDPEAFSRIVATENEEIKKMIAED